MSRNENGVTVGEAEQRVKHLEMVQAVISRLSQQSFTVRGWSVTLVSVVFALITTQAKDSSSALVLVALAPAWMFWGLDAYYLGLERRYRELFTAVARRLRDPAAPDVALFDMNAPAVPRSRYALRAFASVNVAAIPVVLSGIIIGYWAVRALAG